VLEREVVVETFRAGGPGGQHRNVTDSAVRLLHPPSGLRVMASEARSQHRNRETAFARLIVRLKNLNRVPRLRIPTRVPKRAVERRLTEKKHRQTAKRRRTIVPDPDV
jgi:protein subunit release factor A